MRKSSVSTAAPIGAAERLSFLAMSFERAADDETVPLDQRAEFARRANCLRIDARLTEMGSAGLATGMIDATSRPVDVLLSSFKLALLSSFKLALLLRHYKQETSKVNTPRRNEFLSRNKRPANVAGN